MDVPFRLVYEDEYQDLFIDIAPGMQLFNGRQAEHLVRFRSYYNADLGRNAVQMEFMKQLIRQALTREAIMNDPMTLVNTFFNDVRHNLTLADAVRLVPYASSLRGENIHTFTMPGVPQRINGVEYFIADTDAMPETIRQVFYANDVLYQPLEREDSPSMGLRIRVLNGSRVSGLGSAVADMLVRDGFEVLETEAYGGTQEIRTRIMVREDGMGEDLLSYFKNADIIRDATLRDYDIVIIAGGSLDDRFSQT
jgi:hypothetical protein